MKWTKVILHKEEFPIKVYVSEDGHQAVVFPLFGKYFGVYSDKSALDLTIQVIFHVCSDIPIPAGVHTYKQYVDSQEDTAVIYQEAA